MVERTHDLKRSLAAVRAGHLVHNEVAGVTLVAPFCLGDLIEIPVLLHQFELFRAPVHGISICRKIYNITLKMREGVKPVPPGCGTTP
jgi:hypothetical protein